MRVATDTFYSNFISQVNNLQYTQNRLQNEVTSGLSFSLPEDNPDAMSQVLNLQSDINTTSQYSNNVNQLQQVASATSGALTSVQTLLQRASEIATQAGGVNSPEQMATYANELNSIIQQAIQTANTKYNGQYLFGGDKTSAVPYQDSTDASGNVTSVGYVGSATLSQVEIGPNQTATAQNIGANITGSGPRGVFGDLRYGVSVFDHLIALRDDIAAGNTSAISSADTQNLKTDSDNIIYQVGANAALQSTLSDASTAASSRIQNLSNQISSLTNVNLPQTLTQLSQAQTTYQAALESGSKLMSTSLLDYLH